MTDDATVKAKRRALDVVNVAAGKHAAAQRAADKARTARDAAIYAAQGAGATYPELATASGLTRDRIRQVLADQRARRQN